MGKGNGILVISLDFEQYWGMRGKSPIDEVKPRLIGGREGIPRILHLFEKYGIHGTWATVGLLFFENREELLQGLPIIKPQYADVALSPYLDLHNHLGADEIEDPYHYAPSLIKMIAAVPHQEIASHTFSHFYCLEPGQDAASFRADLHAAIKIAEKYDLTLESIVFPKNQIQPEYLQVCRDLGIKAYRGHNPLWIYRGDPLGQKQNWIWRRIRFLDLYFNLLGHQAYPLKEAGREFPLNIRGSRRLRPFRERFRRWEPRRLRRLRSDLTYAAQKGLVYHLWWHPHDFGVHQEENLAFLEAILQHYVYLNQEMGMESLTMRELSRRIVGATR